MARKHEKFTYSHGWRTAPEQWHFGWNKQPIQLDDSTRSRVAQLMLQGKEKEAKDILKRLLRKQEKEDGFVCIGFYEENGKEFYFTQQLMCRRNNLQEKLQAYKEWKNYILKNNGTLVPYTVTTGSVTPDGITDGIQEDVGVKIDLNRPCTIRIKPMNRIFEF